MIREASVAEAHQVMLGIPEFDRPRSLQDLQARLPAGALILVAELDGHLTGFKIAYPLSDDELYSWLGGVLPAYRQSGLAQQLLAFQESCARERGFRALSVKSMNRYPAMLRLLIRNGYQIRAVDQFGDAAHERISFIKQLK